MGSDYGYVTIFSDASSLSMPNVEMYSVPANFFNVVNAEYYVQEGLQDDVPNIETLSNGDANPVQMLYTDEDLSTYPATEEDINNKTPIISHSETGIGPLITRNKEQKRRLEWLFLARWPVKWR